ncbi:MAG: hypothetical protein WCI57_04245 [Candidatus Berkelbacteria bacterium]
MRKYNEQTVNRTLTLYKEDLDTLQENATYKNGVTDQIQEAIKEYIESHGLRKPERGPGGNPDDLDTPKKDKATSPGRKEG